MKKIFYLFIVCMFLYLITYPSRTLLASQKGILLWFDQILPTLLPFSILSNILIAVWGKNAPTQRTFGRINVWEWFVIAGGLLFGFPIGSKLAADIYSGGHTSRERAQILAAFTNNMSPAFVAGYVCAGALGQTSLTVPMYMILYGPPFVIGCLMLAHAPAVQTTHSPKAQKNTTSGFQVDMQIVDAGIMNSFLTLMKLCGYIVMFSITADMIVHIRFVPGIVQTVLVGICEVTNGIGLLGSTAYTDAAKFLLSVLFLSFGGLSGTAQANAMLAPHGLSVRQYIRSKLLYTICSAALGLFYIRCISVTLSIR